MTPTEQIEGVLFGTAVGDSIGLPAEGLTKGKIAKRKWNQMEWSHRFCFGKGMWSDDTEHTFMVGNALLEHPDDVAAFQKSLAWKFRWWLLCFPAGVGLATARACLKLWMGFPPTRSGVFSAGNGPAMRAGIIGATFPEDENRRKAFVRASTELTHCDPKALTAALAVAETVAFCCRNPALKEFDKTAWIRSLEAIGDDEWKERLSPIWSENSSTEEFAENIGTGKGVSGYAYETVPVALHAWVKCEGDFRKAIESVVNCGGDTDTCAAITGALCGAECGVQGIPETWISNLKEWPRTKSHLSKMAIRLGNKKTAPVHYPWIFLPVRNLGFLFIVIVHGLTRIFK